jgi:hypothetical protein
MKKKNDRPITPQEAAEVARKLRRALYINHASYLCTASNISPEERLVAPYLHKGLCKNDYEAAMRWLREYLGDSDILQYPTDLSDLLCDFQKELHKKIPTNYWGGGA